jgi:hypothetical protein
MNPPRRSPLHFVAAGILAVSAAAWLPGADAQPKDLAARSTNQGGVTVVVTPKVTASDRDWEFAVTLDTHSQDLGDDLAGLSVLLVDGAELKPSGWSGAAPGGHHRQGVLRFTAPGKPAGTIELRIQRPNEGAPRVFRWDGADLR